MASFTEALREFYLPQLIADLKKDLNRTLFYNPDYKPEYGPPVPTWMMKNQMFDDKPYEVYVEEEEHYCVYCGRCDCA